MPTEIPHGDYLISDDAARIDVGVIHHYLAQESYWAKNIMQAVVSHPRLQRLRRLALATNDAHGLYAHFGFVPPARPETAMERRSPNPYATPTV